jgi:hypothetical protein
MDISEYGTSPNVDPLIKDIEAYGLFKNVVELEAYGMTVVPPERMCSSPGFIERLREAIIRTCEKRNDVVIGDPAIAPASAAPKTRNGWDVLEEDEVFVEAAINPVVLTLVRWLCGQSAIFGGQTWIIKGAGTDPLGLHSDAHGVPPGAGQIAHMCNASWVCTDYESAEDGPTVFIPGSHKYGRATLPHEARLDDTPFKTFPLIAKAGSLAIWNGATWHGSVPRTKSGLRVTLVQNYFRPYMRTMRNYDGAVSPQLLQKYPELERAIGKPLYPYADPQAPDYTRVPLIRIAGTDPYA